MKCKKIRINMTGFEKCNTIILLVIAFLLFIGVMWMGGTLVGYGGLTYDTYYSQYKPMIIISESMTPTIEVNSLLLVENKDFEDLKKGDIILFNTREYGLVIHRIIDETSSGFITKGDNNESPDNWVVSLEMYKGCVAEIHNEFAPIITFLFGDLENLSVGRLFLGFILIALFLVFIILILKWIYNYICIYHFLKKSSRKGGVNVIKEYYPFLQNEISANDMVELFERLNKKQPITKHLFVRYKVMKLHNYLHENGVVKRKIYNVYKEIRKDLDDNA